ncbi:Uncharacterised protein [Halioglobus japonicus]|nr:Uncharacterised protein [Halioglobus japonicus]
MATILATYLFSVLLNAALIGVMVSLLAQKCHLRAGWPILIPFLALCCAAFDMYWLPAIIEADFTVSSANVDIADLLGESISGEELFAVDAFTVTIWAIQGVLAYFIGSKVLGGRNT